MIKSIKTLIFLVTFTSSSAFAGMKVSIYQEERNTEEIKLYISGVANGFAFANTELSSSKRKAIFCQPSNLLIKVETYMLMLDEKILTYSKDKVVNLQIEPLLLAKLIEVYPCK